MALNDYFTVKLEQEGEEEINSLLEGNFFLNNEDCTTIKEEHKNTEDLDEEVQEQNNYALNFICDRCDYTSNSEFSIRKHILTHGLLKGFKCDSCNFVTKTEQLLQRHLLKHDQVGIDFKYISHDHDYAIKVAKYFKCASYGSSNGHLLTRKVQDATNDRRHLGRKRIPKDFKCDKCVFSTYNMQLLIKHLLKHQVVPKCFKCESCDYVASAKYKLKVHVRTHRADLKCDSCDYVTKYQIRLKSHLLTHKVPAHLKCNHCSYGTNDKHYLKRHLGRHRIAADFKCNNCEYVTNDGQSFKNHSFKHYTHCPAFNVPKRFKCGSCDYVTSYWCDLTSHFRTHNNSVLLKI
uniref:Protein hunchback n=1 Tax=Photinus pyralis TaxID=7054 RepID=A0A1Y1L8A1_PHOPY